MWTFCDHTYSNRLLMGARFYSSPEAMCESLEAAGAELVVVEVSASGDDTQPASTYHSLMMELGVDLLPATTGCTTARDAVNAAVRARKLFDNPQVMLEISGDVASRYPDHLALLEATSELMKQGFTVFPCVADDLVVMQKLLESGVQVLMPGVGINGLGNFTSTISGLSTIRRRFPKTTLILNRGVVRPSEAALAMELGFDGIFVDRPIAAARDPIGMAEAFADAVVAGHLALEAGLTTYNHDASGDLTDHTPVWHSMPEQI